MTSVQPETSRDRRLNPSETPALGGKVLVVDDELPNRLYLKKLLSSYGCDVLLAEDGPAALEAARKNMPDLVLADVIMPGMDGFELCGRLKEFPLTSSIPVIMVTAKSHIDDLKKGFDLGAMDYIRKPFDARELVLRVGNALELKRSNDTLALWKRRVSHELELAGTIQQSMFSCEPFFSEQFEIRTRYRSSMDVGGDAFDIVTLPGGRCCVYLADVSGHGVAPAMISSMLKATAGELIRNLYDRGPAQICNELHVRLREAINNPSYYATLWMALFDPKKNRWVCMNCGHPDPILVCRKQIVPFPRGNGGIPVGMPLGPDRPFAEEDQVILECSPDMHFLVHTDGLSEALHRETGEECGEQELEKLFLEVVCDAEAVDKPGALIGLLEKNYAVGHDDCTAVTVSMVDPAQLLYNGLIAVETQAVSDAAEQMERLLLERADEDLAGRVRLVAMEHAMNVVEHGRLSADHWMQVRLVLDESACRLTFVDPGRAWDFAAADRQELSEDAYAEGGRGLFIARMATDFVERYRRESQNVVSFHFRRSAE